MSKEDRREKLEATCSDMASKLLYYDRKEDEQLPVGTIEEMILNSELTVDELLGWITTPIRNSLTKKAKVKDDRDSIGMHSMVENNREDDQT